MKRQLPTRTHLSNSASRRGLIYLMVIYFFCFLLLLFIIFAAGALDIPYEHFMGDPAMIYNAHPFLGLASNIGILMWCSAAAVCFFIYAVAENRNRKTYALFFLSSALISTMLLLDDFFMFHEAIFPWYLGVPEEVTYAVYAILILCYLLYFYQQILNSEFFYLFAAFAFLGMSVVSDMILPQYGIYYLIEDAFKLFGIASWLFYYAHTGYTHIKYQMRAVRKPAVKTSLTV